MTKRDTRWLILIWVVTLCLLSLIILFVSKANAYPMPDDSDVSREFHQRELIHERKCGFVVGVFLGVCLGAVPWTLFAVKTERRNRELEAGSIGR